MKDKKRKRKTKMPNEKNEDKLLKLVEKQTN